MHPASLLYSLDLPDIETDSSSTDKFHQVPPFTISSYFQTMGISSIAFSSLFLTLSWLLRRFSPFRRLDHEKDVARNLSGFVTSGTQAVTATIAGVTVMLQTNSDILLAQVRLPTYHLFYYDHMTVYQKQQVNKFGCFLVSVGKLVFRRLRRLSSLRHVTHSLYRSPRKEVSVQQPQVPSRRVHTSPLFQHSSADHALPPKEPRRLHHRLLPPNGNPRNLPSHSEYPRGHRTISQPGVCLQRPADHRKLLRLPAGHLPLHVPSTGAAQGDVIA